MGDTRLKFKEFRQFIKAVKEDYKSSSIQKKKKGLVIYHYFLI